MRKFAGTWIALALFAGLVGWLLLAKPKSQDERKEASLTLAKTKRESIDRIEIRNANGTFVLARVSGGPTPTPAAAPSPAASATPAPPPAPEVWKIQQPRDLPVEDVALNQMKNALSDLVAVDPVWDAATDEQLAQVGLKDPLTTVTWHADDGDHGLLFGKAFPKGEQLYARARDSKKVYVVRKWGVEVFSKSLNDFRRHRLFDFDRDSVQKVEITAVGNGTLAASRASMITPWLATSPFTGRADRGKLNNFLARIAALRADDFASGIDARAAGLDAPRAKITVSTSDGQTHTLLVGADAPGGKWYARDAASGEIAVCSASVPGDVKEPFAAWQDKSLLDFPIEDVASLELTVDGGTFSFHRDDNRMWVENTKKAEVNAEVATFLRTVRGATVSERAKTASFDKPSLSASWIAGSGTTAQKFEVTVGAAKGTAHWVRTSEGPDALLVADDLARAARALVAASNKPMVSGTAATAAPTKGS